MKRSQVISIAIVLAGVVLAILLHRPRMLPVRKCSHVYQEYYKTDGLDVTFVKDYELNDSVYVDVTILAATDSTVWVRLTHDFHVPDVLIEIMQKNNRAVCSKMTLKGHYDQPPDSLKENNELIIIYPEIRTVYVLDLESEEQYEAILRYKYNNNNFQR